MRQENLIQVQHDDFDISALYHFLQADNVEDGAVATFLGAVRAKNLGDNVTGLTLEHYPGMTEKSLNDIVVQARERWDINRVVIVHRVGALQLGDNIVFVGVTSPHRGNAFDACEFMMDFLKTRAPFWKKESTSEGDRWIEARDSDAQKASQW
ncbi:MAG: molybdopterin synthase catalytic subunit MoaE [Alteromonadaceae bacterium]|nr:molybdopterin synthase catalytic subunit MoaE [Alteromonadaceae bacterium]